MTPFSIIFFLANSAFLLAAPRKWALLPILLGTSYITVGQGIDLGPISLPVVRLLLLVGFLRIAMRGERLQNGWNRIDTCMVALGVWMMITSFLHSPTGWGPIPISGYVFNYCGTYFVARVLLPTTEELAGFIMILAIVLAPLALEMVAEQLTGRNMFSVFGAVNEMVGTRGDRFRAQGPFRHAILAGTVGGACFPLFIGIWRERRALALIGIISSLLMVAASASSGPIISVMAGAFAIWMWRFRYSMKQVRIAAIVLYIILDIVSTAPAYYMVARIDLTGGSTGWHRARMIEMAITHLNEWWLVGTDYTRHWMRTGVSWSPNHTDITNYFIYFGVVSGLTATLIVLYAMWLGFKRIGGYVVQGGKQAFLVWCLGAVLFANLISGMSVAYFDQSFVFFWLSVALAATVDPDAALDEDDDDETDDEETETHGDADPCTQAAGVNG